jgi:hypothetical protein
MSAKDAVDALHRHVSALDWVLFRQPRFGGARNASDCRPSASPHLMNRVKIFGNQPIRLMTDYGMATTVEIKANAAVNSTGFTVPSSSNRNRKPDRRFGLDFGAISRSRQSYTWAADGRCLGV